jgi:hypothetical protein
MSNSKRKTLIVLGVVGFLFIVGVSLAFSGVLNAGGNLGEVIEKLNGSDMSLTAETQETLVSEVADKVGVEIYDLSMYEESSQEYAEALAQLEEDWFPRKVVVMPKGPEGGEYPNAPLPIYDAFPGQEGETAEGEMYKITRTWIGDIAVGTEVILEGVVQQGEWCFVTGEAIGGWSSSGWVWCYRLFVPE